MSIHRRGNTWEVRWRDGTKNRSRSGFARKIDAQQYEHQILTDLRRGVYVAPTGGKTPLRDWCTEWLDSMHSRAPKTLKTYRHSLSHILPVLGSYPLGRLTGTDIDRYLSARLDADVAPVSVHREYATLRTALRAAVKARKIPRSPHEDATAPVVPDAEMIFLTMGQLGQLAAAFDVRYYSWVLTAGLGGLRWGELAGLQVRSVDIDANRVDVVRQITSDNEVRPPKWGSKRRVQLSETVMDLLAAQVKGKGPDELVWTMPAGGHLVHHNFVGNVERPANKKAGLKRRPARGWFKVAAQTAGLPAGLSPHDLRHTAVALAIRAGAHPKAIQARMGHRKITTTLDRYGHLYDEMDDQIADALDAMWRTDGRRLRAV